MGSIVRSGDFPMLEGNVPEFFFTDIPMMEAVGGGTCLSWHCCVRRGNFYVPQFIASTPLVYVTGMARASMQMAAEIHNMTQWNGDTLRNKEGH